MEDVTNLFVKNKLKTSIIVDSIYTIHYFKYSKNFRYKGEKHNFWELVYIDSGKATIVADGKEFTLSQEECFLHMPNQHHTIYTTDQFANSVIISFESKSKDLYSVCQTKHVLTDEQKMFLNRLITEAKYSFSNKLDKIDLTKMNRKTNSPYGSDQIIKNSIESLAILLIRNNDKAEKHVSNLKSNKYNKIVETIINILNERLEKCESVNLEEISSKIGFSKSYLKTQFKESTGYSIIQYFINMKIDKAKELLSQKRYTISEISDMLGFASLYYFSRQFKQNTSMSPTEYVSSIKVDETL